jgi:hypothetical protein
MGDDPVYPGARPYRRADSIRFRGRASEADRLGAAWLQNRLTYLCGPAGIGKTSLLVAGVLPRVEGRKATIAVLPVGAVNGQPDIVPAIAPVSGFTLSGTRYPIAALPDHNPYSFALLRSWSDASTAARMASKPIDEFIGRYLAHNPDKVILAAIDQADDLFAGPPGRQPLRQRFLDQLAAVLRDEPRLHLLVSVRDDCLRQFTEVIGEGVQVWVDRLGVTAAHEAITGASVFADDAADELIAALRSGAATAPTPTAPAPAPGPGPGPGEVIEPSLLQIACAGLWASLRQRVSIVTLYDLRQHGDVTVNTVLGDYCAAAVGAVADMHEIPAEQLRSWLIGAFITSSGELAAAAEGRPDTAGVPTTAARALEDRHLLRAHHVPAAAAAPSPAQSSVPRPRPAPPMRRYMLLSDRLVEPLQATRPADGATARADPDEYLRAAERARITGERDLASRLAAHVLEIAPATSLRLHADSHSLAGDLAYEQGFLDKAEESYRMAMLLFQACGEQAAAARLLAAIARTYLDRGRVIDALNYMHAALTRVDDAALQENLLWVLQVAAQQTAHSSPGAAG